MATWIIKVIRDAFREIVLEEVVRVLREEQDCTKFDARRIRRVP